MKNLTIFPTSTAYENATLELPNVSLIEDGMEVRYAPKPYDYSKDYLTLISDNNFTFKFGSYTSNSENYGNTIYYSLNEGNTWIEYNCTKSASNNQEISINANQKILFKSTNNQYIQQCFELNGNNIIASGNIMSLLYGDNFIGQTNLTFNNCLSNTFYNCSALSDVSNLILPATILTESCYQSMFDHCTNLLTAPKLPATTLVKNCYRFMFDNCTSLNEITCLATNVFSSTYTSNWVKNVSSNGIFIKNPNITTGVFSWLTGDSGIPTNWTVQNATL